MTIKVLMTPHPDDIEDACNGITQVVSHWAKYLPEYGIELVKPNSTTYDLRASHAGCTGPETDVHHNHGFYWVGNVALSKYEHFTNAMLVQSIRNAKAVTVPSKWVAETFQRDMRFTPYIVGHGVEWDEWAHHTEECGGYVLWNKNRITDVCSPEPVRWLAERAQKVSFISTFAPVGAPSNIRTIGTLPHAEMRQYIKRAAVYLSTTKETFGIGILEAMAAGVPVLGVARGNALELIEHGVTGYLAQNWDDMLQGLWYCLDHRSDLGAAAREAARAYSWRSAAEKVAEVYRAALVESPPTVGIIIPSFNYGDKVGRAIESAIAQTYPHVTNIIVVDDGSEDDGLTQRTVMALAQRDPRVQYIRQSNAGVANARNTGIAHSDTKYIACLDADDAMHPSFIETCVSALEADHSLGIAYTGVLAILPDGTKRLIDWPGAFNYNAQLKGQNQIPTCCVMRREIWKRLGGYRQRYAPDGAGAEDAEFWLRCGAYGWNAKKVSDEGLFIYSLGTGRVSGNRNYREPDWLGWHPWTRDNQHPFASVATPKQHSAHPVRAYDEPIVSVIIPVGPGHEKVLVDALDSVEAQTFRMWEVIVINDTGMPLDLTAYPYVRLVETEGRKGAGYARNRGIEIMRAKLFLCLDADDYLQPTAIAELMEAFRQNEGDWIYSNCFIQHPDGKVENYQSPNWSPEEIWTNDVGSVTCLYTKDMWLAVGGFDEENNREDWDFHLRLTKAGFCATKVARPLFTYRHATGKRRNEGSIRAEVERLRQLYPLEELQEMCRGCSKRRAAQQSAQQQRSVENRPAILGQLKAEAGFVSVEYTGNSAVDILFKGPTGRRYVFNSGDKRVAYVHPDDAPRLLRFSYFRERREGPTGAPIQAIPAPNPVEIQSPTITPEPASPSLSVAATQPAVSATEVLPQEETVSPEGQEILDVSRLTVAELRTLELTPDEWRNLLWQEERRPHPRSTVLSIIRKHLEG